MTHYAQLAEAVEFSRGPDISLVLRRSKGSLDDLVDHFVDDDLDGFCQAHPGVSDYHVKQVTDILADLLRDVPDERTARRQLKKQAHWALLSERVSRLIELEEDDLSDPPTGGELLTLARRAVQQLTPGGMIGAMARGRREQDFSRDPGSRPASSASRTVSSESLQQILAELTDCSSRVRNAADRLQGQRPVHAAYTRELASRVDEVLSDLETTVDDGTP